jgi:hypothetical protein
MELSEQHSRKLEWIVVYVTHSPPDAHIVAGRLESEGIPAMVQGMAGASAIGIHIGQLGEVRVLVSPSDHQRALDILEPEAEPMNTLPETTDYIIFDEDDDADE